MLNNNPQRNFQEPHGKDGKIISNYNNQIYLKQDNENSAKKQLFKQQSPYSGTSSPQENKVLQTYTEQGELKANDNQEYKDYLKRSNENSAKKKLSKQQSPYSGANSPQKQKLLEEYTKQREKKATDNQEYKDYLNKSNENSIKKKQQTQLLVDSPQKFQKILTNTSPYSSPQKYPINCTANEQTNVIKQQFQVQNEPAFSKPYNISPAIGKQQIQIRDSIEKNIIKDVPKEIVKFINLSIEKENQLNQLRNQLNQQQDFIQHSIWQLFNSLSDKKISVLEIEQTLKKLGINSQENAIYLFFRIYDLDEDGYLKQKHQNCYSFQSDNDLMNLIQCHNKSGEQQQLSNKTLTLLKHLFDAAIANEVELDEFRHAIQKNSLNLYETFQAISCGHKEYITRENFLKAFGNSLEYQKIFEKFDKDKDQQISFCEFVQEIAPKCKTEYLAN